MNWFIKCWQHALDFDGRARRKEYWFFYLFSLLALLGFSIIDSILFNGNHVLYVVYSLCSLLPSFAVRVRRLHDLDKSGWWWLIALIPLVGWLVLLVWDCTEGTNGPNRFGPDPLY